MGVKQQKCLTMLKKQHRQTGQEQGLYEWLLILKFKTGKGAASPRYQQWRSGKRFLIVISLLKTLLSTLSHYQITNKHKIMTFKNQSPSDLVPHIQELDG